MNDFVPSSPDPQTTALVAALIRHALTIAAGFGLAVGTYSDSTITMVAGALVGIGAIGWSLYQKYAAAKLDHLGSSRSAASGVAVQAQ